MNNLYTGSIFKPKRLIYTNGGPEEHEAPEADKAGEKEPELTSEQLYAMQQDAMRNIWRVTSACVKDKNPKIRKLGWDARREAIGLTGMALDQAGNIETVGALGGGGEAHKKAVIKRLYEIFTTFGSELARIEKFEKVRVKIENRAIEKQGELIKKIDNQLGSNPDLRSKADDILGDQFAAIYNDLNLAKEKTGKEAMDAAVRANKALPEAMANVEAFLKYAIETKKIIEDAKEHEKGRKYIMQKFDSVVFPDVPEIMQMAIEGQLTQLRAQFEASYALLKGRNPVFAQRRAMLISATADKINKLIQPPGKKPPLSYREFAKSIMKYKGDVYENNFDAAEKKASKLEKGSIYYIRSIYYMRSGIEGADGMKLSIAGSEISAEIMGEIRVVEIAPGKTIEYEKVKAKTKDGKEIILWVAAKGLRPSSKPRA